MYLKVGLLHSTFKNFNVISNESNKDDGEQVLAVLKSCRSRNSILGNNKEASTTVKKV